MLVVVFLRARERSWKRDAFHSPLLCHHLVIINFALTPLIKSSNKNTKPRLCGVTRVLEYVVPKIITWKKAIERENRDHLSSVGYGADIIFFNVTFGKAAYILTDNSLVGHDSVT